MKFFKRSLYLLYYLRETDFKQLRSFANHASSITGRSVLNIYTDAVVSVYKWNISLKDYFCFRFFEIESNERNNWAGTGYLYEYQLKMNPKSAREVLEDKIRFLNHFSQFVSRDFSSIDSIKTDPGAAERLLSNASGKLVLKNSHGQVGGEVEIIKCADFTTESLPIYMSKHKYDLAEEYVIQHNSIMKLSPSGLNTIRIFTQLHEGAVDIIGARFRVSVNSPIDNMGAGNLAAAVDLNTGKVCGPGVYSDITKEDRSVHPITGINIEGFSIPYWNEVIELSEKAAHLSVDNRSVGWDIAITDSGPELIEGNHNWCKLLWQMPVKKGLKGELVKYL